MQAVRHLKWQLTLVHKLLATDNILIATMIPDWLRHSSWIRGVEDGSWHISELYRALCELITHLLLLMTKVCHEVGRNKGHWSSPAIYKRMYFFEEPNVFVLLCCSLLCVVITVTVILFWKMKSPVITLIL